MDIIPRSNVVHKLEKRKLLIAINCVAGLSIFFFGYDQGMMGGVNGAVDYYEKTMKFGHPDANGTPQITNSLLQGGIVSNEKEVLWIILTREGFGLLPWYSNRLSHRRLFCRQVWSYQNYRPRCFLGRHRRYLTMFRSKLELDDLR